jgi:hypothetical protein
VKYELGFYIPEDDILHSHCSENLKSYFVLSWTSDSKRFYLTFCADLLFSYFLFLKSINFLLLWRLNVVECCFSASGKETDGMRYAYGAGPHAGLTVVLNTRHLEYFAPLDPLYGIWVCIRRLSLLSPWNLDFIYIYIYIYMIWYVDTFHSGVLHPCPFSSRGCLFSIMAC